MALFHVSFCNLLFIQQDALEILPCWYSSFALQLTYFNVGVRFRWMTLFRSVCPSSHCWAFGLCAVLTLTRRPAVKVRARCEGSYRTSLGCTCAFRLDLVRCLRQVGAVPAAARPLWRSCCCAFQHDLIPDIWSTLNPGDQTPELKWVPIIHWGKTLINM